MFDRLRDPFEINWSGWLTRPFRSPTRTKGRLRVTDRDRAKRATRKWKFAGLIERHFGWYLPLAVVCMIVMVAVTFL